MILPVICGVQLCKEELFSHICTGRFTLIYEGCSLGRGVSILSMHYLWFLNSNEPSIQGGMFKSPHINSIYTGIPHIKICLLLHDFYSLFYALAFNPLVCIWFFGKFRFYMSCLTVYQMIGQYWKLGYFLFDGNIITKTILRIIARYAQYREWR